MGQKDPIIIKISKRRISAHDEKGGPYPAADISFIEVSRNNSAWLESLTSSAEVTAFIRGVEAGASMHFDFDIIKQEAAPEDYIMVPKNSGPR